MQWLPSLNHEQRSTVLHEASSMIDPQSTAALSKHTLLFSIQPEQTQTHACTHVRTCRCECKTQQTMSNLFSRFSSPHLSHIHKHKHTQAHTKKHKHKHIHTYRMHRARGRWPSHACIGMAHGYWGHTCAHPRQSGSFLGHHRWKAGSGARMAAVPLKTSAFHNKIKREREEIQGKVLSTCKRSTPPPAL